MTNKNLAQIIKSINKNQHRDGYYFTPLSPEVDLLQAWLKKPKITDNYTHRYEPEVLFCIKSDHKYVGIVQDSVGDLHWYLLPEFRSKGVMLNALKTVILPFLLESRQEQLITIDPHFLSDEEYNKSEKLALAVGFKKVGTNSRGTPQYRLNASQIDFKEVIPSYKGISKDQADRLIHKTHYALRLLHQVEIEIQSATGFEEAEKLTNLRPQFRSIFPYLEDLSYKFPSKN